MFRDRTNLYLAYRSTFPHHLRQKSNTKPISNNTRFQRLKQEEEGLLHVDAGGDIELSTFTDKYSDHNVQNDEYTDIIQSIENRGNDLTQRIEENMKQLNKKYKEVLLPQFDDDLIQGEMNIVNELSNTITNEIRMIYKVINELQKLDEVLLRKESEENDGGDFKDINNKSIKGTRILVSNLKRNLLLSHKNSAGNFGRCKEST